MPVTRDVINDLLPCYLAGEASADTRALVESYLATDPELARIVREAAQCGDEPAPSLLPPELQLDALRTTRRLLRIRTWLLAGAIFFTAIPLSIAGGDDGVRFFFIRDLPLVGSTLWLLAAALWLWYRAVQRRLSVTGL